MGQNTVKKNTNAYEILRFYPSFLIFRIFISPILCFRIEVDSAVLPLAVAHPRNPHKTSSYRRGIIFN